MNRKKRATDEEVFAFIAAVYPEAPHLAMAAFDESQCLRDATAELARLASRVAELEGERTKLVACVKVARKLRTFRLPESVNDLRNAAVSDEWTKLTRAFDAARAEVEVP